MRRQWRASQSVRRRRQESVRSVRAVGQPGCCPRHPQMMSRTANLAAGICMHMMVSWAVGSMGSGVDSLHCSAAGALTR
ncbi:hypothetical protein BV20DRAFT_494373 [Pilatotrama ljubarskyi]|nr:hypothetical protein BV20DRAFT_494373 [Pilatotrama ljubarskyi]